MSELLKGVPPLYPQPKAGETTVMSVEPLGDPCPFCLANGSRVADSRPYVSNPAWRRRRRQCDNCGKRWTTLEVPYQLIAEGLIGTADGPGIRSLLLELARAKSGLDRFEQLAQGLIGAKALAELQATEDDAEPEDADPAV